MRLRKREKRHVVVGESKWDQVIRRAPWLVLTNLYESFCGMTSNSRSRSRSASGRAWPMHSRAAHASAHASK